MNTPDDGGIERKMNWLFKKHERTTPRVFRFGVSALNVDRVMSIRFDLAYWILVVQI